MIQIRHKSDCALHNAPAYEPKPCDCGGERALLDWLVEIIRRGDLLVKAIENGKNLTKVNTDFKVGLDVLREKLIEEENE